MPRHWKKRIRLFGMVMFVIYLLLLIYFLFFAEEYGRKAATGELRYNLVPLREIQRFWKERETLGWKAVVLNLLGNVAAFIPFGAILPVIAAKMRERLGFGRTVLNGFIFSLAVESMQLLTRVGSFDVDDLLLNTLGTALGYGLFAMARRMLAGHGRKTRKAESTV